jgi:flavin-dependent dehydrogenase
MANDGAFGQFGTARRTSRTQSTKPLHDGSRVAVIGAGPAGSMFSYFLLNMAESIALDLEVDLYEPRQFCHGGPASCNHCGGVVSESLVQRLATEGISLPDDVVQRGLEAYTMHMDVGNVDIATPLHESRIAGVYRGNGPRNSEPRDTHSFDGYLQHLANEKGARSVRRLVTDVRADGDGMRVECADGSSNSYDLVVMACGVNSHLLKSLDGLAEEHDPPALKTTFICEFRLGRDVIRQTLGQAMHVFLLDIPNLKFAALVPKGDYATFVLLGHELNDELLERFFASEEFRSCFPGGVVPRHVCHCYPRINIRSTRPPYGDRLVMIGDSGSTRLYKDGIGAAYRTAKAAARTAVFHGVSAQDFQEYYAPLCRKIDRDNQVGKLVFWFGGLIQQAGFARRGVLHMIEVEQAQTKAPRRMSQVLWDMFSGSAPYTDIFLRTLQPAFIGSLAWNLVAGNLPKRHHAASQAAPEGRHEH